MTQYYEFMLTIKKDDTCVAELKRPGQNIVSRECPMKRDSGIEDQVNKNLAYVRTNRLSNEDHYRLFGESIYRILFPQKIRELFENTYTEVQRSKDAILRLIVDVEDGSAFSDWPLEYLRCPNEYPQGEERRLFSGGFWLAGNVNQITVSRAVRYKDNIERQREKPPLRVLIIVSSPKTEALVSSGAAQEAIAKLQELTWKDLGEITREGDGDEKAVIVKVLGILDEVDHVEGIEYLERPATIFEFVNLTHNENWHPHIIHYIGHGYSKDDKNSLGFMSANDDEKIDYCDATKFSEFFQRYQPRLIFLQACNGATAETNAAFKSLAVELAARNIPAIVAMQYELTNPHATLFCKYFYEKLRSGKDIDEAVEYGRMMLLYKIGENKNAFGTPVLYQYDPTGIILTQQQPQIGKSSRPPAVETKPWYEVVYEKITKQIDALRERKPSKFQLSRISTLLLKNGMDNGTKEVNEMRDELFVEGSPDLKDDLSNEVFEDCINGLQEIANQLLLYRMRARTEAVDKRLKSLSTPSTVTKPVEIKGIPSLGDKSKDRTANTDVPSLPT